jgi:hypothetical protein
MIEEKRETFKQDAIRAWARYEATGLHVSMEEADAWMVKLASGIDIEPPQPPINIGQTALKQYAQCWMAAPLRRRTFYQRNKNGTRY